MTGTLLVVDSEPNNVDHLRMIVEDVDPPIRFFEVAGDGQPAIPIIALTAQAMRDATRTRAAGGDAYLTKPIDVAELRAVRREDFR